MPVGSDRNLLFGMLALQMDFISRSALIEGMQAWLLDKSRSLGEILVERGALIAANRSLLEPLVEAHIKQHGGDARRSLAALSSDAGIGQDLQRIDDVEIRASIAALPKQSLFQAGALSSAAPINDQVAPSDPNAPPSEPAPLDPYRTQQYETNEPQLRYRVLRPHAEGGLGRIYVAIDQELNREVAFKEIRQDRVSSKEARDRFRIEAEITGGLEHPGIVPVYGLGHYADGRPFYAMRFIRGDSLLEAVRRFHRKDDSGRSMATSTQDFASSLPFRDMVKRLIDVCNAIQYAHDRGVLHRDLKPDNIMLGKYGETLVVDWGLAKAGNEQPKSNSNHSERPLVPVSGSAIDATQYGQALGTYGFMSPEQSEGKLDLLGPASDVYSLGATLYAILTGEAPLRSFGLAELLARLRKGDIPAPRSIQSKTPRPLEAVCQKAMAVAPQDRFLSAKAMTEDLDAWLADQPVSAYREPILLRTRRWLRRHPVAVSTSSVALILTLVGLGLFSSLLAGKNSELATLNSELVSTNQRLDTSLQSEEKAREEAEQNADTARGQSQLAFSTMNVLITDLQGSLENLSGGATVRNAILQKLLPQLNKLSTDFVAKSAINRSSMRAMTELGESILQLGANSKAENSESKDSPSSVALRLFTQAFEIAKQLSEASPSDAQANRDISALHVKLGDVLLRMGQTSEALVHYEVGKELSQKLAEADPSDLKARKYLVGSLGRLGDIQLRLGKNRKAYAHFKDALKVGKKLVETEPNDAEMQRVLWVSHNKLGDVLLHSYDLLEWGQTKNALAHYELALNIIQKLKLIMN